MGTETDSLLWLMGEWAVKGTFLIAFVGVLTLLLKNASAALRHGLWAIGMVLLLCLPLLQLVTPALPVAWLPAPNSTLVASNAGAEFSAPMPARSPVAPPADPVAPAVPQAPVLAEAVPCNLRWESRPLRFGRRA
ncbi:MAG: hypothetical protein RhofKO_05010 [Rhodothermales bacterium]